MVATPCLQWSPITKTLNDAVLVHRSVWLGAMSTSKLTRTRSLNEFEYRPHYSIRRACSATFDSNNPYSSNDKDFSRKNQELALRFRHTDENNDNSSDFDLNMSESEEWNSVNIEMKANSVKLPLSLRMIKRKKNQLKENFIDVKTSAYCSVKTAFSTMVFMIRELHSYSLQMREKLFYEDLQGVLIRVQNEMHSSFVWLFQQVFSHTPTLMVYVMILLANFTVHSLSDSVAFASVSSPSTAVVEERFFDGIKSFSGIKLSSGSDTASVGGNNGGGGKYKPVGSGMDGDGSIDNSSVIVSDGLSQFTTREEVSVSGQDEMSVWNSIVDEASRMQGQSGDKRLEHDVTRRFVSPVQAEIEVDDLKDYSRTELVYQTGVAQEPNNVLLLANYAQFLYLVVHDYDRAEEYFKRAIGVEPKDAEAHNKYANFLWQVRKDLWAAEETYLEAISADPSNSFYAANYAHFLWNTGGEDTCFLDDAEDETLGA